MAGCINKILGHHLFIHAGLYRWLYFTNQESCPLTWCPKYRNLPNVNVDTWKHFAGRLPRVQKLKLSSRLKELVPKLLFLPMLSCHALQLQSSSKLSCIGLHWISLPVAMHASPCEASNATLQLHGLFCLLLEARPQSRILQYRPGLPSLQTSFSLYTYAQSDFWAQILSNLKDTPTIHCMALKDLCTSEHIPS